MRGKIAVRAGAMLLAIAIGAWPDSDAQAQSGQVKLTFEKYGLIGTFAWDCSQPVSKDNLYYVNRLVDPDHVQRDQMESPTTRTWFTVIDKAAETKPNEVRLSGLLTGTIGGRQVDGQVTEGVWRIEQGRMMQWEATLGAQKLIANGRFVSSGNEMPWLNKCR